MRKLAALAAIALLPYWVAIPAWAQPYCVDDEHVCLPGNPEGKPAACYDDGGVIVAYWPCDPRAYGEESDDDPDEYIYRLGYTN